MEEADLKCARCGSTACARPHGWRHRKKVTDLSTGAVFENLPILRVRTCVGTVSLVPGELWRGRFTITSVLEAVVHCLREGAGKACEWAWAAGTGEAIVSESSLRRWRRIVRVRLVGSALSWLGPQAGIRWSEAHGEAAQLEALLDRTTGPLLARFRCLFGRGLLDRTSAPCRPSPSRKAAPRVAGRHDPGPSHDPTRPVRPRGSWLRPRPREPPLGRPHGGESR